jgi:hypothetical protein
MIPSRLIFELSELFVVEYRFDNINPDVFFALV